MPKINKVYLTESDAREICRREDVSFDDFRGHLEPTNVMAAKKNWCAETMWLNLIEDAKEETDEKYTRYGALTGSY